ncbi:hypothetical protein [Marinicella sp. W31]|uniref:hypothetical protein n=1 Tax=Marinicella sp. W31 TaxID=3023713 RepID=UPI00375681EF
MYKLTIQITIDNLIYAHTTFKSKMTEPKSLNKELSVEIKKEAKTQAAKSVIFGVIVLIGFTLTGWWFYLEPKLSSIFGVVPEGAVVAFTKECPEGWTPYENAYGRFIRGIDRTGNNVDPLGERAFGQIQGDAYQLHGHDANMEIGAEPLDGKAQESKAAGGHGRNGVTYKSTGLVIQNGFSETRPKNVSLLYCEKD